MATRSLKRILLVDDDPDIRRMGAIALERVGGFEVAACESGPEALQIAPAFQPDLVLLDVMMPGMDGPSVLKALRDQPILDDVAVIFVTAKVQKAEFDQYLQMGARGVIKKPFDPMQLADDIRQIWASSQQTSDILEGEKVDAPAALMQRYRAKLSRRLDWIDRQLAKAPNDFDDALVDELRRIVHQLVGSGKVFGYPIVSRVCGEFQQILEALVAEQRPVDEPTLVRLRGLCEEVRNALQNRPSSRA